MTRASKDALAGDNALGGHRVGGTDPLDPRDQQEGHRQNQNHDPDGRQRPVARVFRDVKRTDSGCNSLWNR